MYAYHHGLITTQDPHAHVKFLKPSPSASPLVDRCIECGFCESNCPSRDLTLSPRQRIAAYKEINRLRGIATRSPAEDSRLQQFEQVGEDHWMQLRRGCGCVRVVVVM